METSRADTDICELGANPRTPSKKDKERLKFVLLLTVLIKKSAIDNSATYTHVYIVPLFVYVYLLLNMPNYQASNL